MGTVETEEGPKEIAVQEKQQPISGIEGGRVALSIGRQMTPRIWKWQSAIRPWASRWEHCAAPALQSSKILCEHLASRTIRLKMYGVVQ